MALPPSSFRGQHSRQRDPTYSEPGHDFYNKALTNRDINRIVTKMKAVRTELGPVIDFAIENHWKYDTSDAITLLNALEHLQPMWVEDPLPPENTDAMARLARATRTPICTGENLYGVHGFRPLIGSQACAGVHIDIPKSGGLLESKRISDLADMWEIWTAAHNPASPVGTIASAHAAASMRGFRIHELAKWIDWCPTSLHEGPFWRMATSRSKTTGLGVEINPDVAKAT
jgi:L-alanine-DL-glutamate epimerase-like enolase superfamily enzyme